MEKIWMPKVSARKIYKIIKILTELEKWTTHLKDVTKTVANEISEQKWWYLTVLFFYICQSMTGNLLAGKGVLRVLGKDLCQGKKILVLIYSSKNFGNEKYFENTKDIYWCFKQKRFTYGKKDCADTGNFDYSL